MERGSGPADHYVLPRHPTEADRLDIQHYAYRAAMGRNFIAPVQELGRALDVGCGTGRWAHEVCEEFSDAFVVGLDLEPARSPRPANYRFVQGNLLQGLPFPDGTFDFVHQRLLISGVPVRRWPVVVEDLMRVARPGGWVELVEASPGLEPEGPATRRLYDLFRSLARTAGLDTFGHVFGSLDRYLVEAGAQSVQKRTLELPIGEWAGRRGAWMLSDYRALFTRMASVFETRFNMPQAECMTMLTAMLDEFEQFQPVIRARVAIGRRPA